MTPVHGAFRFLLTKGLGTSGGAAQSNISWKSLCSALAALDVASKLSSGDMIGTGFLG